LYRSTRKDTDFRRYKECRKSVKELRKARKNFEHKLAVDIQEISNPTDTFVPKQNVRSESVP